MRARLESLPLIVLLLGVGALAMFVPAIHAYLARELHTARAFFYGGVLLLILFALLAFALAGYRDRQEARGYLVGLVLAYTALPLALAVPFHEALGNTRFVNSWFEMVSAMTTTGASAFAEGRLWPTLDLWRAIVAWLGGFLAWVAAVAVLAPMNLGGFEVLSARRPVTGALQTQITRVAGTAERMSRFAAELAPIYAGLTLLLWTALLIIGTPSLEGAITAMSTLSTSGITLGGQGPLGMPAELLVFIFLIFAVSRLTFSSEGGDTHARPLGQDPELRMGAVLCLVIPVFLFLRHWAGAYDVAEQSDLVAGASALWGALFTTLSFLTTTGFESAGWDDARSWSGLETPGLALLGLALIGGGVATTAGGVKLLRIYALFVHGSREMEKLVLPNSVGGAGSQARRLRREGAYLAWIFFMLFAMSVALVMGLLTLTGLDFEAATVLTIAALSTTGPLAQVAGEAPIHYFQLDPLARLILAGAMVLGRLETLALVALLNPAIWRN